MENIQWLGLTAGACTTVAFIPQLVKTWKTKSATDLSLVMFSVFSIGLVLWLVYGIINRDGPIIAANAATLSMALVLVYFKLKYK